MIGILIENVNVSLFVSLPFCLLGHAYVSCVSTSAESLLCGSYVVIGLAILAHLIGYCARAYQSLSRNSSAFRQSKMDKT